MTREQCVVSCILIATHFTDHDGLELEAQVVLASWRGLNPRLMYYTFKFEVNIPQHRLQTA